MDLGSGRMARRCYTVVGIAAVAYGPGGGVVTPGGVNANRQVPILVFHRLGGGELVSDALVAHLREDGSTLAKHVGDGLEFAAIVGHLMAVYSRRALAKEVVQRNCERLSKCRELVGGVGV